MGYSGNLGPALALPEALIPRTALFLILTLHFWGPQIGYMFHRLFITHPPNSFERRLTHLISIWDEKLQNLQALTDPFPTNLHKLQHLKNCQMEGCKYSRSLVVLENIVLPICRNALQWIKLFDTPFIYKKLSHQKIKSPGTIQNSMKILENPKPNCFFQINTTK
jgi:hypothetical protein